MEKLSSVKSVTGAGMVPGRCLEGSDQTWGSVHTGRSDQPEVVSLCGSEAASRAGQEVEGACSTLIQVGGSGVASAPGRLLIILSAVVMGSWASGKARRPLADP